MKSIKKSSIFYFSLLITLFGNFLEYINVIDTSQTSIIYAFMLLPILVGIPHIIYLKLRKIQMENMLEIKIGFLVFISLITISFIISIKAESYMMGSTFIIGSLGESLRIFVPFIYAFLMINLLDKCQIMTIMKISLIFSFIAFFLTIDYSNVSLSNIISISFSNSYSPFENSNISMMSYALAVYFIYYREEMKKWTFFSVLLVFLTFKRVFMLGMIIFLLISLLGIQDKRIKKSLLFVSSIFWICFITFVMYLLLPQNYSFGVERLHFDIVKFTMARAYRVWYLIEHNFISYGLGSTTSALRGSYLGTSLELDFIKILMELGIIAVTIIIFSYYWITKGYLYSYAVMSINFLQLTMANGLTRYFEWSIVLVTIALVNINNSKKDNLFNERLKFESRIYYDE